MRDLSLPLRIALALTVCLAAWLAGVGPASAAEPLYQLDPYDQITLDKDNDNAVLKVRTLDLPDRLVPKQPAPEEKLKVRLLDQPDKEFEVQWKAIVKVELFEQMVLNEANQLVKAGKFDEAFDYFAFLQEKYAAMPGLKPAIENYLFEEAKSLARKGEFDAALSAEARKGALDAALVRLREIHRLDPQRPGLSGALGVVTDKLCTKYQAEENYPAIRGLVAALAALEPQHPQVMVWQSRLKERAAAAGVEARKALDEGRLREADRSGRKLVEVWPATPGLKDLLAAITAKYPRVVVGVTEPARPPGLTGLAPVNHAGRSRATPVSPGARLAAKLGGAAEQPADLPHADGVPRSWQRRRQVRLPDGRDGSRGAGAAAALRAGTRPAMVQRARHAQRIRSLATPAGHGRPRLIQATASSGRRSSPACRSSGSTGCRSTCGVRTSGRRPSCSAWWLPSREPGSDLGPATNGPYARRSGPSEAAAAAAAGPAEAVYTANAAYFAARPSQPQEIVERRFPAGSDAIKALRRGQIDVLDRVNPWEVDKVAAIPDVVVEPYAVPLVHCLVPNLERPLVSSRTFRRALVYGIHRKAILNAMTGGKPQPGCQLTSGPFSPGVSRDDPLDYAYDHSIDPRPYDPRLAIGLAEVAFRELAEAKKKQGQTLKKMPPFVLAYPADAIARLAAGAIKKQLALVGIPVNLEELPAGVPPRLNDKIDLLYAELAMWEPVVDARRLLDRDGLAGSCSPYMSLALKQLEQASDWPAVGLKLRQIHQLAHSEVAVVPLWQLTDFFAYRRRLSGVGPRPVTLYQHVESWKVRFQDPTEEGKR